MDFSVIIRVANGREYLRACIASIERTLGGRRDLEVIVADDGDPRLSQAELATLRRPRYRTLALASAGGDAAVRNAAVASARGRHLIFLDDDTVLTGDWLTPMRRALARAPRAGVIGNVHRDAWTGLLDHAGISFGPENDPVPFGRDLPSPPTGEWSRWPAAGGACCLMRRDLFQRLGGFDEAFGDGFEDIDFCLRAGEVGRQHYVAHRSVIYHHLNASPGGTSQYRANLQRFQARWSPTLDAWAERCGVEAGTRGSREAGVHERQRYWNDGWRYVRKHLLAPWRYNSARLSQAVTKIVEGRPQPRGLDGEQRFFA